jgi:hypothetical protein
MLNRFCKSLKMSLFREKQTAFPTARRKLLDLIIKCRFTVIILNNTKLGATDTKSHALPLTQPGPFCFNPLTGQPLDRLRCLRLLMFGSERLTEGNKGNEDEIPRAGELSHGGH